MSIRVVATGRVIEGPSQLLDESMGQVFVLDPFPDSEGARARVRGRLRQPLRLYVAPRGRPSGRSSGGFGRTGD